MNADDLNQLREREKELNCIYRVIQVLRRDDLAIEDVLRKAVREIPRGWSYPGICMARIIFEGTDYTTPVFHPTRWYQRAEVVVDENVSGEVRVYYARNITGDEENLFLPEEQHLLNTLAEQISIFIFNRQLRHTLENFEDDGNRDTADHGLPASSDRHWKWRYKMARLIAEKMDFERLGVQAVYLIGSTKEAQAGPASDLDLLVVHSGDSSKKTLLEYWIDGWSHSMAETNTQMTGHKMDDGMIDLHLITPRQLKSKSNSFAAMIGNTENSARLLREKKS